MAVRIIWRLDATREDGTRRNIRKGECINRPDIMGETLARLVLEARPLFHESYTITATFTTEPVAPNPGGGLSPGVYKRPLGQ